MGTGPKGNTPALRGRALDPRADLRHRATAAEHPALIVGLHAGARGLLAEGRGALGGPSHDPETRAADVALACALLELLRRGPFAAPGCGVARVGVALVTAELPPEREGVTGRD